MAVLSNEALSTSTMLTRRPPLKTSCSDAIGTSKILKSPIVWNGRSSFAWISDDQHKKVQTWNPLVVENVWYTVCVDRVGGSVFEYYQCEHYLPASKGNFRIWRRENIHAKFKGSLYRAVIANISHTYSRVLYMSSQNGRPNIGFISNEIDSNKGNKAHLP